MFNRHTAKSSIIDMATTSFWWYFPELVEKQLKKTVTNSINLKSKFPEMNSIVCYLNNWYETNRLVHVQRCRLAASFSLSFLSLLTMRFICWKLKHLSGGEWGTREKVFSCSLQLIHIIFHSFVRYWWRVLFKQIPNYFFMSCVRTHVVCRVDTYP